VDPAGGIRSGNVQHRESFDDGSDVTAFLQVWSEGADVNRDPGRLSHTASDLFRQREVEPGDTVYVAEMVDGHLELIGRLKVSAVVDEAEARRRFSQDVWHARDHLIAVRGSASEKVFERRVEDDVARSLRFLRKTGRYRPDGQPVLRVTELTWAAPGYLDPQTTRTVRRLDAGSAAKLEQMIRRDDR
jgi:hypothetical protein